MDAAAGRDNPSALYKEGLAARRVLGEARKKIAQAINAHPDEIIFTSGGTESNNLAILGTVRGHVVTSKIEHESVLEPVKKFKVTYLKADKYGLIYPKDVRRAITARTSLVSIMYANNEMGTVQDIVGIRKACRSVLLHTDACQAVGSFDLNVKKLGVDLMSFSGYKFGGPRGIGFLYVKRGTPIKPIIFGGGQEFGLRSGTENVQLAQEMADKFVKANFNHLIPLRDYFISEIQKKIPDAKLNGHPTLRLPNNINFSFKNIDNEWLVIQLDEHSIAASTGAACNIAAGRASHITDRHTVRFTLHPKTTKKEIDYVIMVLKKLLK